MIKALTAAALAAGLVLVPAGLASADNGNGKGKGACVQLGEIHRELAKAGLIPSAHSPGSHRGMAGLCFGD